MYRLLILYFTCFLSMPCYSQDMFFDSLGISNEETEIDKNEEDEFNIQAIEIDGQPFVAFDVDYAKFLLQMRLDYPKLELKLKKVTELVTLRGKLVEKALELNENLEKQLDEKDIILQNLQKQIEDQDSFWNSPFLWTTIGALVGTGLTLLVVETVK